MANEVRLIDANALAKKWQYVLDSKPEDKGKVAYRTFEMFIERLNEEPAIDPESLRPKGRWIHCEGKSNLWYCSECGEKIQYNPTRRVYNIEKRPVHEVNKYCRSCGAIMEG